MRRPDLLTMAGLCWIGFTIYTLVCYWGTYGAGYVPPELRKD